MKDSKMIKQEIKPQEKPLSKGMNKIKAFQAKRDFLMKNGIRPLDPYAPGYSLEKEAEMKAKKMQLLKEYEEMNKSE
jgi:hypothetical protein